MINSVYYSFRPGIKFPKEVETRINGYTSPSVQLLDLHMNGFGRLKTVVYTTVVQLL